MLFTFEALQAKHGDCLLLHYGDPDDPKLIVIDGGPAGVYRRSLAPRLEELRGDAETLRARMLMVSHIDDDHIHGVLDLFDQIREDDEHPARTVRYDFETLWHNSFDDLVGDGSDDLLDQATEAVGGAAALTGEVTPTVPVGHQATLVLAGVRQGRALRLQAEALGLVLNQVEDDEGGLLVARDGSPAIDLGDGLTFRLLGPLESRVRALRDTWDRYLENEGLAQQPDVEVAAFLDRSVANLASLMVLAEAGCKRMLLTGDGRGDDLLEALEAADPPLLDDDGKLHVDLFKLPHHGSHHNVAPELFERVTADHYVFSGDGKHHNPEIDTFRMLLDARGPDAEPYTLHLTYAVDDLKVSRREAFPTDELQGLLDEYRDAGHRFEVASPGLPDDGTSAVPSLRIPLLD